jgi:hypothetical protein
MAEALIGLLGGIVGAALTACATYVMARRAEARRMRSVARLLEAELRPVGERLAALDAAMSRRGGADPAAIQALLAFPELRLWDQHKATLAEVLDDADWYALVDAYDSIAVLRGLGVHWFTETTIGGVAQRLADSTRSDLAQRLADRTRGGVARARAASQRRLARDMSRRVIAGADAIGALAGEAPDRTGRSHRERYLSLLRQAGEIGPGAVKVASPERSPNTRPPSTSRGAD